MKTRWMLPLAAAAALFLGAAAVAPAIAQDAPDPILKFEDKSEIELDLGIMVDDLLPQLMTLIEEEGDEDAQAVKFLVDLLGLEAFDRLHMKSEMKTDRAKGRMVLTLKDEPGLLGDLFAVPDGGCGFAKYVPQDETAMFSTWQNFAGVLDLLLQLPARPEFAEMAAGMPMNEDGDLALPGFTPRTDLLPLLSGELDVLLLGGPEGGLANPMEMPVYLVLGTTDGFALRDMIFDLAINLGGEQAAGFVEMIRAMEPELIGDFELIATPFGGAFAVSEDFFVLGMTGGPLRTLLAEPAGDLKVPEGCSWSYMDGEEYGKFMGMIYEQAGAFEGGDDEEFAQEMLNRMYEDFFAHLDYEIVHTTSDRNRVVTDFELEGSILSGYYGMLRSIVADLPEIVAKQKAQQEKNEARQQYNGIVSELDGALTQYGVDHGGLFPADPAELVAEGYLAEFPLEVQTPLGEYVEGAYTYVTLHDAEGRIAGYYLFVYGGGAAGGYDVFTPDNLQGVGNFVVDQDGLPDGVASFCYDGMALQQMENWRAK